MKIRQKTIKGDTTSMIDCIFLLLIFFIVTAKFITPEGYFETWLPKDKGPFKGQDPLDKATTLITLRMTEQGKVELKLDKQPFGLFENSLEKLKKTDQKKFQAAITNINQHYNNQHGLMNKLIALRANTSLNCVSIDADPQVPFVFVAKAIDSCKGAQIHNIQYVGAKKRLSKENQGVIK